MTPRIIIAIVVSSALGYQLVALLWPADDRGRSRRWLQLWLGVGCGAGIGSYCIMAEMWMFGLQGPSVMGVEAILLASGGLALW